MNYGTSYRQYLQFEFRYHATRPLNPPSPLALLNAPSSVELGEMTRLPAYDGLPPAEACPPPLQLPLQSTLNFDVSSAYEQQADIVSRFPSSQQRLPSLNIFGASAPLMRDVEGLSQDIKIEFNDESWLHSPKADLLNGNSAPPNEVTSNSVPASLNGQVTQIEGTTVVKSEPDSPAGDADEAQTALQGVSNGAPAKKVKTSPKGKSASEKPPYSYVALICMAITQSPMKKLTLSEIYSFIMHKFPYYDKKSKGWQNSIRHNLSLNDCFDKIDRESTTGGKGCHWAVNPLHLNMFPDGNYQRRRRTTKKLRKHPQMDYQHHGVNLSGGAGLGYQLSYHPAGKGPANSLYTSARPYEPYAYDSNAAQSALAYYGYCEYYKSTSAFPLSPQQTQDRDSNKGIGPLRVSDQGHRELRDEMSVRSNELHGYVAGINPSDIRRSLGVPNMNGGDMFSQSSAAYPPDFVTTAYSSVGVGPQPGYFYGEATGTHPSPPTSESPTKYKTAIPSLWQ